MNDAQLLATQIKYEQKAYWRNPISVIFTFAFPLILFVVLNAVFGHQNVGTKRDPISGISYYTPSILAYAVLSAGFLSIAMQYVQRREFGIFKRLRGTPLPSWILIGGTIGSTMIVTFLQAIVALLLARFAYSVHFPASHLFALFVTVLIATMAFCAIGIAASTFIPNADAGPAVVNLPYFVLVFISGTYFPIHGGLARVAGYFPLRPFFQALQHAVLTQGASGFDFRYLDSVLIWGAVAAVIAARRFKWAPRRG